MDLRSLIEKLDTIEKTKLLLESEQLMEKVRIRYSDVEAVAKQYATDDDARGKALAKLAADNGLKTLFDPVSGELVNSDGSYSTFKGADEATVERLKSWGLLPLNAKTSSWLGFRGQDRKTAIGDNQSAQSRDQMVDRAEELMKKAVTAGSEAKNSTVAAVNLHDPRRDADGNLPKANESVMFASGIAESLLSSFGYSTTLLEYVTPEEHSELKGLVQKLTPFQKQDPDAADIVARFNAYNEKRNDLIARIKEVIAAIKPATVAKSAEKSAEAPAAERSGVSATVAKESLQESKQRMITEGRMIMLEDGSVVKDGQHYLYNESRDTYYYHDENGLLVEYSAAELWQDTKDTGRGVVSGAAYGLQDPLLAKAWSLMNGTSYHDELKKQIAQTDAARQRSPWLYSAGQIGGWFLNPVSYTGVGGVAGAATSIGTEVWRDEMNAALLKASEPAAKKDRKGGGTQPKAQFDAKVKKLQKQLMAWYGPNAVGPFKDDGIMGNDTMKAIKRAQKDGKLPATDKVVSTPEKPAAQVAAAPGEEIVAPSSSAASAPEGGVVLGTTSSSSSAPSTSASSSAPSTSASSSAPSTSASSSAPSTSASSSAPSTSASSAAAPSAMAGGYGSGANNPELAQSYTPDASITPELVKSALAKVGVSGNTISPDQILQVAAALGIEGAVAESKELQDIRRLAGTEQLDELWELVPKVAGMAGRGIETGWNALKGLMGGGAAADAANVARTATGATDAANVARTATTAASETLPNVLRQGGKTYDKVGNTYKVRGGSEVVSVDDMALRLGRADGRLSPGGTRVAAQDAVSANAARRTGAATDAMARAGNAERAAGAVVGAERAAVAALPAAGRGLVNSVKGLGGKFVNLLKNNRFLTLLAVLGAIGLVTSGTIGGGGGGGGGSDNQPVKPQPVVDPQAEERKRQLVDLEKLLAQLYGGWPTDAETAETIKAAVAAGAKTPEGFKEGGVATQPANSGKSSGAGLWQGQEAGASAEELIRLRKEKAKSQQP
jgi:hypothetical protein